MGWNKKKYIPLPFLLDEDFEVRIDRNKDNIILYHGPKTGVL